MKTALMTCGLWALLASPCLVRAADPRVDRIFAEWDRPGSPGCALAVVHNASVVYARGYGVANLELNVPITPDTVFDIGSVSKQFTAMSVVLLAEDGKLSLEDDVHKFIPELPPYGATITLRSMLHHLSGLRSYTDLFDLAGVPEIDNTTEEDALALIARQRSLNFPPGRQYLYSDTNYFLLSLVVRRVAGESLAEFARRRIFAPLGMNSTHYHDDHRMIVPRRATGYAPRAGGGFDIDMSNFEQLGDGSVMTTVGDLARWDGNFYSGQVGGAAAIAMLQQPGARSDGSPTPYAMGLILDRYRGFARVQHTGEWVGYRASLLRFPERRLSVIVLCNMIGEMDPLALSERVADVYLHLPAHSPTPAPAPGEVASYAGTYWDAGTLAYLRFTAEAERLALDSGGEPQDLQYRGHGEFGAGNSSTRYAFHRSAAGVSVTLADDDADQRILERVAQSAPDNRNFSEYTGSYYSEDLGVSWTLAIRDGRLVRTQWMFPAQRLEPILPDTFAGELSEGGYALRFSRAPGGEIEGFEVASTMVRPLRFARCAPAAPDERAPLALGCRAVVSMPDRH